MGFLPSMALAEPHCNREHDTVTLTGHLSRKTYAGPPNFESIRRGDAREVTPVLLVKPALCIWMPGEGEDARGKAHHVKVIQLLDAEQLLPPEPSQGRHRFTGRLMLAETGHHHEAVLMEVEAIDPPRRP
ncbi:MAG: DUF4431 domain-containing protein [Rubrivivax sp.]|nr:MAG: DUF4431 domain-containing protein [Rubrivivax sp.]